MSLVNVSSNAYYGYVQQYARANQRLNHVGVTKDDLVAKLTDATTAMDVDGDCRKGAVASLGIYSITDRSFDENLRLAINDRWLRRNDSRKRRNGEQEPGVERKRHCTETGVTTFTMVQDSSGDEWNRCTMSHHRYP